MNKNVTKNFFYQAIYQVTLVVLPIITIPIVSHALGAEGVGVSNYTSSIVSYFTLVAGLGLANYGVREIAIVRNDVTLLSKKFWELQFFNAFFSITTLAVYLLVILFLPNKILYIAQIFVVAGSLFDVSWFFAGIEDFKKISLMNVIVKIISFILIITLVKEKSNLITYVLIQSLSIFVSQLGLWLFLPSKITFVFVNLKDIWFHFKPALNFFVAKISATIFVSLTKTILGLLTTMSVVGIYSNSLTLVFMSGSIINALNVVMIPYMSNMSNTDSKKNEKKIVEILQKSLHLQLYFTIAIMFGIIGINGKMISWFYGEGFSLMKYTVPLLAVTVVLQSLYNGIASQFLIPRGEMKAYNLSILYGAIASVIIDVTLIPIIGIYGAIIGNVIGHLLICILRIKSLYSETDFKFDFKKISVYILSGIFMLLCINFISKDMSSGAKTTVVQVLVGISSYLIFSGLLKQNPMIDILRKRI